MGTSSQTKTQETWAGDKKTTWAAAKLLLGDGKAGGKKADAKLTQS